MKFWLALPALMAMCFAPLPAQSNQNIPDQYPGSPLYAKPLKVAEGVWAAIGATGPPTYENTGHNNNLTFIVTNDGVVVINGGAAYILAEALHKEIKAVTDQPVKLVVNENGQGHAMLGNSYWAEQGVKIIAHSDASAVVEETSPEILARMKRYNKEKAEKTTVVAATETFDERMDISMGGVKIELISFGPAHSPGDISVWLPDMKLVIAGDMAFHQRLLPLFADTETAPWLESWEGFAALEAEIVIPGHGSPTNMVEVTKYTKDYLIYLRGKVSEVIENGGTLQDAYEVDQSPYVHLHTFEELAKRNAGQVFQEMEFE